MAGASVVDSSLFAKSRGLFFQPKAPGLAGPTSDSGENQTSPKSDTDGAERDPMDDLKRDLGSLLDQPQRLGEPLSEALGPMLAECCLAVGLDPQTVDWKAGRWQVEAAADDRDGAGCSPLRAWWPQTIPGIRGAAPARTTGPPS